MNIWVCLASFFLKFIQVEGNFEKTTWNNAILKINLFHWDLVGLFLSAVLQNSPLAMSCSWTSTDLNLHRISKILIPWIRSFLLVLLKYLKFSEFILRSFILIKPGEFWDSTKTPVSTPTPIKSNGPKASLMLGIKITSCTFSSRRDISRFFSLIYFGIKRYA